MTIEIHQPELEALIANGMQNGGYATAEDYLLHALGGNLPQANDPAPEGRKTPQTATGALLVAALQACPYPEVPLIRESMYLEVRDVEL